ncbi:Chromatin structure-remodeling complex subunit rsc9 [Termitomyces sp. J132]|nr:Chromatin structure-remodeling complex subunit rsc9 [Termitomyces sp. J132]
MASAQMSTMRLPQNTYYRNSFTPQQQPARPAADIRDDYERWYTEGVPSNRMSLSLRSGILSEVGWALDRLCRLCYNESFLLTSIPGLIDGLFDWPEWYIAEGYRHSSDENFLFSPPHDYSRKRRYALESLFVLRNVALYEPNALELANHSHTLPLILTALSTLQHDRDEDSEFMLNIIDLYHIVAAAKIVILPTTLPAYNPLHSLTKTVSQSSNRSMIIAAFTALTVTLSNPVNTTNISADSPTLAASIRYLPLFADKPLVDACLNYIYVHISSMAMAKAFLLRSDLPAVLRILVTLLLDEQEKLEEKVVQDISGTIHTVPAVTLLTRDHILTKEELDELLGKPEPQRCYDWMKAMFVAKPDGEVTQVDFWNLYKDVFSPHAEQYPLLVASDVIKNVNAVFPEAQAMVLQGPVQRFIVRGVDRRKDAVANERFKCQWNRSECSVSVFSTPGELYEHLLGHLTAIELSESPCLWSTCLRDPMPKSSLRSHVLTHLSSHQPPTKHPSQSDTITLPSNDSSYPIENPTIRLPPPPRSTTIAFQRPLVDPPSIALTALLCLRILFRTSFASADAAPRVDADHFGFPGVVEEQDDQDFDGANEIGETEREGERRGRQAFVSVQKLLEEVRIRDDVLMGWVTSKYIVIYTKLLEGLPPHQIAPHEDRNQFFTNLFNLDVKNEYLRGELNRLSKESCLGSHKPFLNMLFRECLMQARDAPHADIRKAHALETLSIILRSILSKNLSGWEVMEILGGGVGQSDDVFMILTNLVEDGMRDETAPRAYFLRCDLFSSITTFIKSCDKERFVSEAALLLAILANFHKSDAGKLNPYLKCIRSTQDAELMRKICWAVNKELMSSIQSYMDISDDSFKYIFTTTLGSMFASLRSDRTLSTTLEPSRELFKNQPIIDAVFLLPIFELLRANSLFPAIIVEDTSLDRDTPGHFPPLLHTILTLSSYILTHATSASSPRSLSYANLSLHILLALVENDGVMGVMIQPSATVIPICRQDLYPSLLSRGVVSSQLSFTLRSVIFYAPDEYGGSIFYIPILLEYVWKDLWAALLGLLGFLTTKIDSLDTTAGVEQIVRETIVLLYLSLIKSDGYLPSPQALHEFIYELIRFASILKSQESLLKSLTVAPQQDPRQATWIKRSTEALASITELVDFYQGKVTKANARTAKAAMSVVAREIETDGLYTTKSVCEPQAP